MHEYITHFDMYNFIMKPIVDKVLVRRYMDFINTVGSHCTVSMMLEGGIHCCNSCHCSCDTI